MGLLLGKNHLDSNKGMFGLLKYNYNLSKFVSFSLKIVSIRLRGHFVCPKI